MGRRGEGAPSVAVLIPAAGAGERMGEGPKALVELAGRPMLEWSLLAVAAAEEASAAVVVAAPPGGEEELRDSVAVPDGLALEVVAGGTSRSESVAAALELVEEETAFVAIHDAARPLVTPALIDDVVRKLAERADAAGVIPATAVTDTIKRAMEPRDQRGDVVRGDTTVARTESRDELWAAQTPQVFRAPALREALAAHPHLVTAATDEAWLVEKAGGKVLIHPSSPTNLKVTTRFDLRVAELLLAERGA